MTGVSRGHSTGAVAKGRAEHEEGMSKTRSLRDERGRQTTPDRGTTGQAKEVKQPEADARAELYPMRDERKSDIELWERIWERENLNTALKRVESNRGAPGADGMTVKDLRSYLKENWKGIREALERGNYQPRPVKRVEIPKADGGVRLLGIPTVIDRFYATGDRTVANADL